VSLIKRADCKFGALSYFTIVILQLIVVVSSGLDLWLRNEGHLGAQHGPWGRNRAIKNSIIEISIKILCNFFSSHCYDCYKNIVTLYSVGRGIAGGLPVSQLFIFNRLLI